MYIERILFPITVLGIGQRVGIWFQGCEHKCEKCINQELWVKRERNKLKVDSIVQAVKNIMKEHEVDGITLTGGDPVYQIEELTELVKIFHKLGLEILLYTGFLREQIVNMPQGNELLSYIDVLIDGPYVDALNEDGLCLRGSKNQKIYYINKETENRYQKYLKEGRKIQQFYMKDYMISVGIHDKPKFD